MLTMPQFHSPLDAGTLRVERVGEVAAAALELKKSGRVRPASEDRERVAFFGIDVQIGFCHPQGSLFVPGAVEDTQRVLELLHAHLDRVTTLVMSLDTHHVHQIFHPSFWRDAQGEPPPPFTPVTSADVKSGRWTPVRERAACIEYVERLEKTGKYVLTIWPYHALLGGVSHALVPAMMELTMLHALARDTDTVFETKGTHALTENYSVLSPEVTELGGARVGAFNEALFDTLMKHDRVYVFGQAKSHCVLSTLFDMRDHIARTDRALAKKVFILEDAMSPVPPPPIDPLPPALDFPRVAERGLGELRAFGMNVVTTRTAL
jgi:nicotinamidase-related amidase